MFNNIYFNGITNNKAAYTISDTDFCIISVEVDMLVNTTHIYVCECISTIIKIYNEKNLNVAINIVKYLQARKSFNFDIIKECRNTIPDYNQYDNDVQKYLILF